MLFPQQGSCHLLLHDGTVPRTGPGTRRVSVKASTRCRPNEARKALSHFRPASGAVPENSPPTLHSRTCPVGGAVVKDRPQLTYEQANSGGGGGNHSLRTAHQGSPYPQNRGGAELPPACGLEGGGGLRDQQSSRVASSCPCRTTVAAPTTSNGGGAGGPRSGRREDVRALL